MSVTTKEELLKHIEHDITIAYYGESMADALSVTVECMTCHEVLVALGDGEAEPEEESYLVGPCKFQRADVMHIANDMDLDLSDFAIDETWQELIPYMKQCENIEDGNIRIEELLADKYT